MANLSGVVRVQKRLTGSRRLFVSPGYSILRSVCRDDSIAPSQTISCRRLRNWRWVKQTVLKLILLQS